MSATVLLLSAVLGVASSRADPVLPPERVIVVLADQHAALGARTGERARAIRADRAPVATRIRAAGGHVGIQFSVLNGFAATITPRERERLQEDPAVQGVYPDVVLPRVQPPVQVARPPTGRRDLVGPAPLDPSHGAQDAASGLCSTDPAHPVLEPEALGLIHAASDDPAVPTAQTLATGAGVTVGFAADGVDPDLPDLLRTGGARVITDYRSFGDLGPTSQTGTEATGDAASIAAQGHPVYDLGDSHGLPGCKVRILGVAPGADLAAVEVFHNGGGQFSQILQAFDWLVNVDHVDVLNESLGFSRTPDSAQNLLRIFDADAVSAGVTVVVSSGDGGRGNTINSPGSEAGVITAGASTSLRVFPQTGLYGAALGTGGWESDNVSSMSSSGFTQAGRTIDLVAPGDRGWSLCCSATTSPGAPMLQLFNGTSEAAPLVAGTAALVIQAYRQTHGGATPDPALVERLIVGSADDLGVPGQEQGAGRLNAHAAVEAARSVSTQDGAGVAGGSGIVTEPTQLDVATPQGTGATRDVSVTNVGAGSQTVHARVRAITTQLSRTEGTATVERADPLLTWNEGYGSVDARSTTRQFTVPAGADRLDVTFGASDASESIALLDPHGAFAAYSFPTGAATVGNATVRAPAFGTWTLVVLSTNAFLIDPDLDFGLVSTVDYAATTSRFGTVDAVEPASLTLAHGQSGTFRLSLAAADRAGDSGRDLELTGRFGHRIVVPIALRSLVDLAPGADGSFDGRLTAGNGRPDSPAQTETFAFDVPDGAPGLDVQLGLRSAVGGDPGAVHGFLIDPDGNHLGRDVTEAFQDGVASLRVRRSAPRAGRWLFVLAHDQPLNPDGPDVAGLRFAGTVSLRAPALRAHGVPDAQDGALVGGQPIDAVLHITNDGAQAEAVVVDARLRTSNAQRLLPVFPGSAEGIVLPFTA